MSLCFKISFQMSNFNIISVNSTIASARKLFSHDKIYRLNLLIIMLKCSDALSVTNLIILPTTRGDWVFVTHG